MSLLRKAKYKLRRREIWTVAIYKLHGEFNFDFLSCGELILKISDFGQIYSKTYKSICADPFIIIEKNVLNVFFETKTEFEKGKISCVSFNLSDTNTVCDHGVVLEEDFHLSFPNVFRYLDDYYMVPESAEAGNVFLYVSRDFPYKWQRIKVLVNLPIVDLSVFFNNGVHLVGTDRIGRLLHYYSPDLFNEFTYVENVKSIGSKATRNGGNIFKLRGKTYRIVQVGDNYYGERLTFRQINSINNIEFSECEVDLLIENSGESFMNLGYHHLSMTSDGDNTWVAIDGFRKDTYFNFLCFLVLKIFTSVKICRKTMFSLFSLRRMLLMITGCNLLCNFESLVFFYVWN